MQNNETRGPRFERASYILMFAALGFFLLSFIGMGLAPWTSLQSVVHPPDGFTNPYIDEQGNPNAASRGRSIYIREGCWHCHSQFVRPVAGEPFRYGPASAAWESAFDIPQTFGTRRIGPDLAREAGRRPDDWHFAHLMNPRSVVPQSIMPSYPNLFTEKDNHPIPTTEGTELVAYLQSLGAGFKEVVAKQVNPEPLTITGKFDQNTASIARGDELFQENCVGCHGENGNSKSKANELLKPPAVDLASRYIPAVEVFGILFSGVKGSAMPSFHEMPEKDLWAISTHVESLGMVHLDEHHERTPVDAAQIAKGKTLYNTNCAACHGIDGMADSEVAKALVPRPRRLAKRLYSAKALDTIFEQGRPGTAMPPFAQLSAEDRNAISHYLASIFKE